MGGCCSSQATLPDEVFATQTAFVLWDENCPGSLILRNFKSPRKYSNYQKIGCVWAYGVGPTHLFVYDRSKPVMRVLLNDVRLRQLNIDVKERPSKDPVISILWDVSIFQSGWEGTMEARIVTAQAHEFRRIMIEASVEPDV